ncbi:transcription factor bHLH93-like [Diospyros lotus]|uniref:transcription factor bHLH93-like n=1 Tax=Diospyros lotus TaxID=55363 RepID=UPI002250FE34|nr:transcription factor bHLH93-like [Diospyros lotus]
MEYNENGFLEELLALRTDPWEGANIASGMGEFYSPGWSFDCFEENPVPGIPQTSSSFQDFSLPLDQTLNCSFSELYNSCPFGDEFSAPEFTDHSSNTTKLDTPPLPAQEDYSISIMEDEEAGLLGCGGGNGLSNLDWEAGCKLEPVQCAEMPNFSVGFEVGERKSKAKKVEGQPSKNLMAERRRRKRLNDRLSMLRSVVPKISKMDRTSILGDTIDYMKELLEKINSLQEEIEVGSNQLNLMSIFKDVKPNEILVRNSPKFDVERGNADTRIEICCAGKPGLLLSTVTTLEALGLEIQQCVISCFNDFAMQASCSEEVEQRAIISSEDIKQALFRNAGYGGRCL